MEEKALLKARQSVTRTRISRVQRVNINRSTRDHQVCSKGTSVACENSSRRVAYSEGTKCDFHPRLLLFQESVQTSFSFCPFFLHFAHFLRGKKNKKENEKRFAR